MKTNGRVGESMTLNAIHETSDGGEPVVVVHCPEFNAVGSGADIVDALMQLAAEIHDLSEHFIDEPDEKLAPDALQLKQRMREWLRHEGNFVSAANSDNSSNHKESK